MTPREMKSLVPGHIPGEQRSWDQDPDQPVFTAHCHQSQTHPSSEHTEVIGIIIIPISIIS